MKSMLDTSAKTSLGQVSLRMMRRLTWSRLFFFLLLDNFQHFKGPVLPYAPVYCSTKWNL